MNNDPEIGTGAGLPIATGMRRSELFALLESDINWAHHELHVNKLRVTAGVASG